MRNLWMVSMVAVAAAGCDGLDSQAWDKNHDGLVAQCEGLGEGFCQLTPGCQGQQLACLAICLDDGKGGCVPCPSSFECVPKPVIPCSSLSAQQCSNDPRCVPSLEVCAMYCDADARGGACPPCGGTVCRDRQPDPTPSCALVPINSCASIPACEVQTVTVCSPSAGGSETDPSEPPDSTGIRGGCMGPPCTSTQTCVNKVQSCEARSADTCTANPACELVSGAVCDVSCMQDAPCPPCATPQPSCVTRASSTCETRSIDQCTSAPGCMVEGYACAAICEDDGKGGCLPCPGLPSRCVAIPSPTPASQPPPTK